MTSVNRSTRLDHQIDEAADHILGPADADIALVEYGSYACPSCRAAHNEIVGLRDRFGDRMRYVFRHRPIANNPLARRAAELSELCADQGLFWKAHVALMTRSAALTEADLDAVATELALEAPDQHASARAAERVRADEQSAADSGVLVTPTFFINGRRYEGAWDQVSLSEAMLGSLGHRMRVAALDFARWAPSAGILLLFASVLAIILANSPLGPGFAAFWQLPFGLSFAGMVFEMPLLLWVNDALLAIFFLVVGLEIKREFTVGHLTERGAAMLPIAAAIGGMLLPALAYAIVVPAGPWSLGWGVPMATDTAFAIALIAILGARVPVELRIFLTAAAIVDDIGAILVVAAFYTTGIEPLYLAGALGVAGLLWLLNLWGVYRLTPYLLLGVVLWAFVHAGGLHATLAGVVLALFIPTRPPPNLAALTAQAEIVLMADARRGDEVRHGGPSLPALEALDVIHDRLESPADRLLRRAALRSSYLVLPIFALVNAGVAISTDLFAGRELLMAGIAAGLVLGKPLGFAAAAALAVWTGVATKPTAFTWAQLVGAGALAGIGFTMSLFIAGQAFPVVADFAAAKIAIFGGSILAGIIGVLILFWSNLPKPAEEIPKN